MRFGSATRSVAIFMETFALDDGILARWQSTASREWQSGCRAWRADSLAMYCVEMICYDANGELRKVRSWCWQLHSRSSTEGSRQCSGFAIPNCSLGPCRTTK
jgi:hypothetical protein